MAIAVSAIEAGVLTAGGLTELIAKTAGKADNSPKTIIREEAGLTPSSSELNEPQGESSLKILREGDDQEIIFERRWVQNSNQGKKENPIFLHGVQRSRWARLE